MFKLINIESTLSDSTVIVQKVSGKHFIVNYRNKCVNFIRLPSSSVMVILDKNDHTVDLKQISEDNFNHYVGRLRNNHHFYDKLTDINDNGLSDCNYRFEEDLPIDDFPQRRGRFTQSIERGYRTAPTPQDLDSYSDSNLYDPRSNRFSNNYSFIADRSDEPAVRVSLHDRINNEDDFWQLLAR